MNLLIFLAKVVGISLSGAMAPGPVTATAIAMGSKNRFAGVHMAVGHGIIELPLMLLIVLGIDRVLQSVTTQIVIGLVGGVFLLIMGGQMLTSYAATDRPQAMMTRRGPLVAGIILSGSNPYFLLWWATIGLTLATTASELGAWAFVLFALAHWSCDLVWFTILSWASFKGSTVLGPRMERIVLVICGVALVGFGLYFIGEKVFVLLRMGGGNG